MTAPGSYQVLLLGVGDERATEVRDALADRIGELGLDPAALVFLTADFDTARNRRLPAVGLFFGGTAATNDSPVVEQLLTDSMTIAPVVSSTDRIVDELPPQLRHVNAVQYSVEGRDRIVSLVLEVFKLLRRERKLFISYRRSDSQPFAERLYDVLDSQGFDVFIDVRSVPPAVDFQSELWHRMSDSDVVVLVDTPGFRSSRWTTDELARANATNIQILHILWPGQPEDPASSFSHFLKLDNSHFSAPAIGRGESVTPAALASVYSAVERLRARAIAARYRYLVDGFCDAARDLGMKATVHPERWIEIQLASGGTLAAVPAVGVPTSDRLNAIFDAIAHPKSTTHDLWVIYDNRGLLSAWLAHLDWLSDHLPIRAVRMSRAPALLKKLVP